MSDSNSITISVLVDLLEQHSKIHYLSISLTSIATILLIVFSKYSNSVLALNITVIIFGIYEVFLAIRIGFDINLFKRLTHANTNIQNELNLIDRALLDLKLIPSNKSGRQLDARIQGVKILFKKQIITCLGQMFGLIIIGIIFIK